MDIQTAKLELVRLIVQIDDPQVIERLLETIGNQKQHFEDILDESVKEEIRLGIRELDNGNRIAFEEFIKGVS